MRRRIRDRRRVPITQHQPARLAIERKRVLLQHTLHIRTRVGRAQERREVGCRGERDGLGDGPRRGEEAVGGACGTNLLSDCDAHGCHED